MDKLDTRKQQKNPPPCDVHGNRCVTVLMDMMGEAERLVKGF